MTSFRHRPCACISPFLIAAGLTFILAVTSHARAQDTTVALLRQLADAPGPSGFEEPVRKIMVDRMKPYADSIRYDGLGSVIAQQGSSGPRIMLDAHMDELGGIIRRVTPGGMMTMQMLGGWLDQALVDQRWIIIGSKGPVQAVTGIRDTHVVPADERGRVFPRNSLLLDVGVRSPEEVRALGISMGDPVVPDSPFTVLNGTDNYLGKAWDDRAGCAIAVLVLEKLSRIPHVNQLFVAATTQEELGMRGAHTSADVIKPDIGIVLEAGITGDTYFGHPEEAQEKLGAGPGLFLYDSTELPNRKFAAFVRQTASGLNLPLQEDMVEIYGDDSAEIQKSNGGVPTVNLVIPLRYTHAHNGIMNRKDFDQTVDLVVGLIQRLDAAKVAKLRDFAPGD
jgi:putative aminopeptidase FrvX